MSYISNAQNFWINYFQNVGIFAKHTNFLLDHIESIMTYYLQTFALLIENITDPIDDYFIDML